MFSFRKNLIGIDIGTYSVKAVSLSGKSGSYSLVSYACFKLPAEGGQTTPANPVLLFEIARSQRLKGKAAILMSGPSLVFRHLRLPQMPERDLKEAVRWEMRKETTIPPGEMAADYVLAGAEPRAGENTVSLIAFAARKAEVSNLMGMFKGTGLEPRVVEAAPTALYSAFDLHDLWETGLNYAMLDVGDSKSTLVILKNRKMVFAREIPFGGKDLTRALADGLNKDDKDAEEIKITQGLNLPDNKDENARTILSSALEVLCTEIHRSFDYYQAQFREGAVSRLFISGGTARLKGIEGFVTEMTGIPSFADDPLRSVKIPKHLNNESLKTIAPCLTMAAGLAVRTEA